MLSAAIRQRLRDPAYCDLHFLAVSALAQIDRIPWYDAHFLRRFEAAKIYLAAARPDCLDAFIAGFAPLRPAADTATVHARDFFPAALHDRIRAIAQDVPQHWRKPHELEDFGRHVVHDHAFFMQLQRDILPQVEELAGRKLEPGYNFLSLYGATGRCEPHMDEPMSMYTLDYCIDQSEGWPIHFSRIVDWPTVAEMNQRHPRAVLGDPAMQFTPKVLQPNDALLFIGSSQWHYRDAIAPGGFCNLLFFHYYPAGCGDLVWPARWARHFAIPELQPLCDLFEEALSHRRDR